MADIETSEEIVDGLVAISHEAARYAYTWSWDNHYKIRSFLLEQEQEIQRLRQQSSLREEAYSEKIRVLEHELHDMKKIEQQERRQLDDVSQRLMRAYQVLATREHMTMAGMKNGRQERN